MRVNLLFGFLGSGKTTLARRLLDERGRDLRTAVIVNEFGEIGIDGDILRGNNVDMVELNSGCLCCSLKGSLLPALAELRAKRAIERVIVEATGVAQPGDLIETLTDSSMKQTLEIGPLVCVVDAAKFNKLETMLGEFYLAQIESADIVILNKTDMAGAQELEQARRKVQTLNPAAAILLAERCDVDSRVVLDGDVSALRARMPTRESDRDDEQRLAHHHSGGAHRHEHDYASARAQPDVESFVLDASANRKLGRVESFFRCLPDTVWRAKGFTQINGEPVLLQYGVGQLEITPAQARANMNLVFIGRGMDRGGMERRFTELAREQASVAREEPASP